MVVPDFQAFMLPQLLLLKDKKERGVREIDEYLKDFFHLSETDVRERLPSGKQTVFSNRASWARTYLKKAGLIESPIRARVAITELGLNVLSKDPKRIDNRFLSQFAEFKEFHNQTKDPIDQSQGSNSDEVSTPEEVIANAYNLIKGSLAHDLIIKILAQPPDFFERLVIDLLVKMGYGGSIIDAGKAIGRVGDEGIDGTIKEDRLGLDVIYVQAKRWQPGNIVGRPELHKFVGALAGQGAKKGIFITTSSFSKEAEQYTPKNDTKIVLIDGARFADLMIENNVGVYVIDRYELRKIDDDYFSE